MRDTVPKLDKNTFNLPSFKDHIGVFRVSMQDRCVYSNPTANKLFNIHKNFEIFSLQDFFIKTGDKTSSHIMNELKQATEQKQPYVTHTFSVCSDSEPFTEIHCLFCLDDLDHQPDSTWIGLCWKSPSNKEQPEKTRRLSRYQQMIEEYHTLTEEAPVGIFRSNDKGICVYSNKQFQKFLGKQSFPQKEYNWLSYIHPDMQASIKEEWNNSILNKSPFNAEFKFKRQGMPDIWCHCISRPIPLPGSQQITYLNIVTNTTEQHITKEKLIYLARYDDLTGLPNRNHFIEELNSALLRSKRQGQNIALLFIDLDGFKAVNDTLGHEAGDLLLKEVSTQLKFITRETDLVARLGGDEFTILIENITHNSDAATTATKILKGISKPFQISYQEVFITASIGIAYGNYGTTDPISIIKHADIAMYQAKNNGKNNFQFYAPEMNTLTDKRMRLNSGLHRAMIKEEFTLFFQPQVDIKTNQIIGSEALLRWNHPEFGMVSPNDFIPLLEENGLIIPVSEWAVRQAFEQCKNWSQNKAVPAHFHICINFSACHFKGDGLVRLLEHNLETQKIEPENIVIEITESLLLSNSEVYRKTLDSIHQLGMKIALDDFGTGYSSLSYLNSFPIDIIKMDQSFVKDIFVNPNNQAIIEAIISLSHKLNLTVIAEGVETPSVLDFLRDNHCDIYQGYLCSKPLPVSELQPLLIASSENQQSNS